MIPLRSKVNLDHILGFVRDDFQTTRKADKRRGR